MKLKHRTGLLPLLAGALAWILLSALSPAVESFAPGVQAEVTVLMYHSIVTRDSYGGMYAVPLSRLEDDLAGLQARGYHFVSPRMLLDFVDEGAALPEKPVLLTFDDGYRNNFTLLPGLLERYDAYGVVAVVGRYCDAAPSPEKDTSPHISIGWEELEKIAAECSRLTLASHSYDLHETGPRLGSGLLPGESQAHWQEVFCRDAQQMTQALEEHLGSRPWIYAYPFGVIAPGADDLLQAIGFRMTFSCREERCVLRQGDGSCLLSMGRFNRDGRLSSEEFLEKVECKASAALFSR